MERFSLADKLITGVILLLGMAETGHLLMVFGCRPFSDAVTLFGVEAIVLVCVVVVRVVWKQRHEIHERPKVGMQYKADSGAGARQTLGGRRRTGGKNVVTPALAGAFIALSLFILYQIMTITSENNIDRSKDMTLETVESILETENVYQVNPLTGRAYTDGVPLRIKILGLPTFYAILCRMADNLAQGFLGKMSMGGQVSAISHWTLLTKWVPLCVLLLSYMAFWTVGKALFPRDDERIQRLLFLTIVSAVLCAGSYIYGLDGFGLLYCGYRGVTLRGVVLLPYTFGLALRHRWRHSILCVLAEGCIVWTLYGMGMCLAVLLCLWTLSFWREKRGSEYGRRRHIFGEEA